jgi:hypothetical protein
MSLLESINEQSFLVDPSDYSSINYSNYLSVVAEIKQNNPAKYAACRSFLKSKFAAAIHRETYYRYYIFLTLAKDSEGNSYLKALGSSDFVPSIPKQEASKIALEQADSALACALRCIEKVLPDDSQHASRIYVGSDVAPVNPVVPSTA